MGEQHWSTQPPPVLLNPAYLPEGGWAPPPPPSSMPVVPTRYPMFWRTPAWSVWRPILAFIVGFGCFLLLQVLAMVVALAIDVATGRIVLKTYLDELSKGRFSVTPVFFLANNVALGLSIPVVMLISRWLFRQPGRHLASVIGRIRWRFMLGYAAAISLPWLVMTGLDLWWGRAELSVTTDTWLLLVGILLTTPFQAAGEEFLFRGGVMRTFASFVRRPAIGIPIGALVQALLFMAAHGAGDASLNAYYLFFGLVAAWLVWRTGGLEAAIAVHVVNNVTSELSMPFTDISHMFDRQEGAASLADLWPGMVCLVLAVGIAEVFVRRLRPAVVGPEQATRPVLEQAGPRPAL
ncbi:CPBP family intramembrane glutamic endopeptidase [Aestuariimicrobium kwangyangense]|uniref:CPBP family intramembrane glutamic endopeptidase n=1 Tax=Aestuariimicrobium kwangyangense TaxID=396389 RepID=UPI0003B69994|nr:CPBP family intramembrane glutamic endopeptidase [Aestuariimicrobium kwangyangense]